MICALIAGTLFCGNLSALPIFSLVKQNRGLFGYHYVGFIRVTNGSHEGWEGDCHDPGWAGCRTPRSLTDSNDQQAVDDLCEFAEVEIANGSRSGSKQILVHVEGESVTRRYTVTWTATPVLYRPTETTGNGQSINLVVDRTDITI